LGEYQGYSTVVGNACLTRWLRLLPAALRMQAAGI